MKCGGFKLKTWGLLIGFFELFIAFTMYTSLHRNIFDRDYWLLKSFLTGLYLTSVIFWLKGIFKRKLDCMALNIFISICCFVISVVGIITCWIISNSDWKSDQGRPMNYLHGSSTISLRKIIKYFIDSNPPLFWLACCLFCNIQLCFIAVKYSLFKTMKDGYSRLDSNVELGEHDEEIC